MALTLPLWAAAPVPSIVALQPLVDSEPWIYVIDMLTVLVVELKANALTGIVPVIVTEMLMPSTEQPFTFSDVTVPMPKPARPLPFLKEPVVAEDVQVTDWPAVVSVTTVVPALPVVAPPGLTVHVAAVANAGAAAMPITAAVAALVMSALPKRLRIALTPFPCRSCSLPGAALVTPCARLIAERYRAGVHIRDIR